MFCHKNLWFYYGDLIWTMNIRPMKIDDFIIFDKQFLWRKIFPPTKGINKQI